MIKIWSGCITDEDLKNLILKTDNGDIEAMVMIGDCYNKGFHTEKDDSKSHFYYKKATDAGHPSICYFG